VSAASLTQWPCRLELGCSSGGAVAAGCRLPAAAAGSVPRLALVRGNGSWALQKQGAVTLVGTSGATIADNLFTRLDGNAIFMGGFHRDLEISHNDFEFIGDSAMASWGDTSDNLNANGSISVGAPVGPDGRSGNQNRGARVSVPIAIIFVIFVSVSGD
jgi:hypothetical protein